MSEAPPINSVYDAVKFDIKDGSDDYPAAMRSPPSGKRSPIKKLPALPKLKHPISPISPTSPQPHPSTDTEDTLSLDSYEEMSKLPGLTQERGEWQQERGEWQQERQPWQNPPPPAPGEPHPPPPPPERKTSTARAKVGRIMHLSSLNSSLTWLDFLS